LKVEQKKKNMDLVEMILPEEEKEDMTVFLRKYKLFNYSELVK
jgi:hypothetical protein